MRGKRLLIVALVGIALVVAAVWLASQSLERESSGPRPDVVLGSGSFEGRDWVYGYNVDEMFFDGRSCFQLVMEGAPSGCGRYTQPVETMVVYHGSGGDPGGLLTAQGVVSDKVARVECGTGAELIGETHLFDMPGDELRPVLCLGTDDEVAERDWFAFAFDVRGRQIAKSDVLPRKRTSG